MKEITPEELKKIEDEINNQSPCYYRKDTREWEVAMTLVKQGKIDLDEDKTWFRSKSK